MGCDIHAYIEYFKDSHWNPFGGRINPGRNYFIFAKIAGVRNYNNIVPVMNLRGLPAHLGYEAARDLRLYISENGNESTATTTMEKAKEWVRKGISKFIYLGDKPVWVTHPDWHSHTWLTSAEWGKCIEGENDTEYDIILAVLTAFERKGYNTRVVIWFDN